MVYSWEQRRVNQREVDLRHPLKSATEVKLSIHKKGRTQTQKNTQEIAQIPPDQFFFRMPITSLWRVVSPSQMWLAVSQCKISKSEKKLTSLKIKPSTSNRRNGKKSINSNWTWCGKRSAAPKKTKNLKSKCKISKTSKPTRLNRLSRTTSRPWTIWQLRTTRFSRKICRSKLNRSLSNLRLSTRQLCNPNNDNTKRPSRWSRPSLKKTAPL